MNKLMIAFAMAALATFVNAASIDWSYTGAAAQKDYTVLLYTSAIKATYASYAELVAGAIDTQTVVKKTVGPSTTYKVNAHTVTDESVSSSATLYYVLVSGSDATTYSYGSVSAASYAYDASAQQTSPGVLGLKNSSFASAGTIKPETTPEPTSGLLLVFGMAGLALRRKMK